VSGVYGEVSSVGFAPRSLLLTLRCTQRLLHRLPFTPVEGESTSESSLGDWYAHLIPHQRRPLVLCTNERTLLSIVIPLAPGREFVDRCRIAAQRRLDQITAPAAARLRGIAHLSELQVGRTRSRSVLASMNQLAWGAECWLQEPEGDLEALGLWLCDTPMSALETGWPWKEAVYRLTGTKPPPVGIMGPRAG